MPAGRPSTYQEAFCDEIIGLGEQGYSLAEMATHFGVIRETLNNWAKEHPEFFDALTRAKESSLSHWEKLAREGVHMGSDFNASLWAKSMAGRFPTEPYRDRVEMSGQVGVEHSLDLTGLSDEALAALASIGTKG